MRPLYLVREVRPDCPAEAHDSAWARERYRCCCPLAIQQSRQRQMGRIYKPGKNSLGYLKSRLEINRDPFVLRLVVRGNERMALHCLDREEAVAQLTDQGLSAYEIAKKLEISSRTVVRMRAKTRVRRQAEAQPDTTKESEAA